jgi:hypothetical protein
VRYWKQVRLSDLAVYEGYQIRIVLLLCMHSRISLVQEDFLAEHFHQKSSAFIFLSGISDTDNCGPDVLSTAYQQVGRSLQVNAALWTGWLGHLSNCHFQGHVSSLRSRGRDFAKRFLYDLPDRGSERCRSPLRFGLIRMPRCYGAVFPMIAGTRGSSPRTTK